MICKKFGNRVVLNEIKTEFPSRCSLIVGENGAGKTTLLKILSGLIKQYKGDFVFNENVSLLLDNNVLFDNKKGFENLEFFLSKEEYFEALKWTRFFTIDYALGKKVKTYSNGMKKRLMFSIAFAKKKEILILDEPTTSLDYDGVKLLKKAIKEIKKDKMIIMSSHDISIVDADIIDDIYELKNGRLYNQNINKYNFKLYKIKTYKEINKFQEYLVDKDNKIYKVYDSEKEKFFEQISRFIPMEILELPIVDELYFKELYNEENI